MADKESNRGSNSNVKWIVIGIVSVVALVLFKTEIAGLIDRTETVSVTAEGVILKTRTAETVLGETIVSGPPTIETAGITADAESNFKESDSFKINWNPDLWSNNQELASLNEAELLLLFSSTDGFKPSISVQSHAGYPSAKAFLDSLKLPDRKVAKIEYDAAKDTGIRTSVGEVAGQRLYFIERVLFNPQDGLVYVATTERPVADKSNEALWESTRKVLNSFRLG